MRLPDWVVDERNPALTRLVTFDPAARNLAGFLGAEERNHSLAAMLIRWAESRYPAPPPSAAEKENDES